MTGPGARGSTTGRTDDSSGGDGDPEWKLWLLVGVVLLAILGAALLGPGAGGPGTELGNGRRVLAADLPSSPRGDGPAQDAVGPPPRAECRARTDDLFFTREALYQLS